MNSNFNLFWSKWKSYSVPWHILEILWSWPHYVSRYHFRWKIPIIIWNAVFTGLIKTQSHNYNVCYNQFEPFAKHKISSPKQPGIPLCWRRKYNHYCKDCACWLINPAYEIFVVSKTPHMTYLSAQKSLIWGICRLNNPSYEIYVDLVYMT